MWSQGKVPSRTPDVLKVPSWDTCWANLEITQKSASWLCFVFSYLEVPFIVVVERLEKLLWLGDVCHQLEFSLQNPESKQKGFLQLHEKWNYIYNSTALCQFWRSVFVFGVWEFSGLECCENLEGVGGKAFLRCSLVSGEMTKKTRQGEKQQRSPVRPEPGTL